MFFVFFYSMQASKTGGFENSMKLPVNSVYFGSTVEQATETNVLEKGEHLRMLMKGVQEMGLQEEAEDEKKRQKEKAFSLTNKGLKEMDVPALHRLCTNILDIPSHVYNRVCSRLNVKDELFFRDFRLLGEVLGYPKKVINRLSYGSMSNTTDEILQMWSVRSGRGATVGRLIELLMRMGRRDVVEILQKGADLSSEVTEIPLSIYRDVCSKLDTRDDIFYRDYRMLAERLNFDRHLIVVWEQLQNCSRPNPTNELLKLWSFDSGDEATVQRLIELLKLDDLKRMDVVKILEDWVFGG